MVAPTVGDRDGSNVAANVPEVPATNPHGREQWKTVAVTVNERHPIRFLTRNWSRHGGNLTQSQWEEIRPIVVEMLNEENLFPHGPIGADHRPKNTGEAIEALECIVVERNTRDSMNPDALSDEERKHVDALVWAILQLCMERVVVPSMQKIVGAAITCEIQHPAPMGNLHTDKESGSPVGVSSLKIRKADAHGCVTALMKGCRVLDEFGHWDLGHLISLRDDPNKLSECRNLLACFGMLKLQVAPWVARAKRHLVEIGVAGVEGLLMGERDTLTRAQLGVDETINGVLEKLPLAVNDDDGEARDAGLATAGGGVSAALAKLSFFAAQRWKSGGCAWQLESSMTSYCAVVMTVGEACVAPLGHREGMWMMKAFKRADGTPHCSAGWVPDHFSAVSRIPLVAALRLVLRANRKVYDDMDDVPPPDEATEMSQAVGGIGRSTNQGWPAEHYVTCPFSHAMMSKGRASKAKHTLCWMR